jgi:Tfp pilus assembly major pilin PilA
MKSKQAGITLMGFLIVLAVIGFFAFMGVKLFPSYTEYAGVVKAMNQIASEGVEGKSLDQVRRELMFKLGFQYVDDATIQPSDINFQQGANGNELHVAYDKQVPFMYNVDFLIHFDKSVPVRGNVAPPQ